MKGLIRNRKGGVISVVVLILMPLFIIAMIGVTEIARMNHSSTDLQGAIDNAVRACASRVDKESQANADIRIDPISADMAFRHVLAHNLDLDELTLAPSGNSSIAELLAYQLVVVNGTNRYAPEGYVVTYNGGYSAVEVSTGDLPVECGISNDGINIGGTGAHQTILDAPGCVAIVKIKAKAILTSDYENVRWAAAKIKTS